MARKSPVYPYLRCRSFGHSWGDPYIDTVRDREYRARTRVYDGHQICQDCSQCPTVRRGFMDVLGSMYSGCWSYVYPQDYRWTSEDPMKRQDWRRDYVRIVKLTRRQS